MLIRFVLVCVLVCLHSCSVAPQIIPNGNGHFSRCYDEHGNPQKCVPEFVNAAFDVQVEATSTCGEDGPMEYCIQSGALGLRRACDVCDARNPRLAHPASYLTDLTTNDNETWWQSETMYEGVQWPTQVNLTLNFRKSFDITYVRLKFHSPRPESFAIYRRTSDDSPWVPYQYYSATCRDFYALPDLAYIHGGDETRPLCSSEFSDISPLSGGNVAFSTLEGRPSAYNNFENSKELQEWVSATGILVTLDRLNTFGDEVFGDEKVLRSYFYAISDFAVGGTCKCNGHAYECVPSSSERSPTRLVCRCEHNTAGPDCGECLPFYNDAPWGRATSTSVNECKPCNCNEFSTRCYFDQKLYESTGHGGHCTECGGNRDGPNCERCKPNFYQRSDGYCIACYCNEIGSRSLQCNSEGKCQCQPGVTGEKCDRCLANYYEFNQIGCKECSCSIAGSFGNEPNCDTTSGICQCKVNVEGQQCDKCKPSYFNLDVTNDFGCTPCFCYGHSAVCRSAPGYGQVLLESTFAKGKERWTAEGPAQKSLPIEFNAFTQNLAVTATGREAVYFLAPERFLGDQRGSYNQEFNFSLRIGEPSPKPTAEDIIIEGSGLRISKPIFGQRNSLPSMHAQDFSFRLHEHPDFGWNPRLSAREFISVLSNITAIKIRGTYSTQGKGFLDNVILKTARRGAAGAPAPWVEMCTCPEGYIGQYCESCAAEYTREPKNGGPFARCVPCSCNSHAKICDIESGQCICQHNTGGDNCERCARGYYGNALDGTAEDCKPCPCPNGGACIQLHDETVVCLECPTGYAGPLCEFCGDGYFGDPKGPAGPTKVCQACKCNGNIDPNAVGNCNRTTGECLKCIYNTGGPKCDICLPGFFGDPFGEKGNCKQCDCNPLGTVPGLGNKLVCDQVTGQCTCKANVTGKQCDKCEDGYFDLTSGNGCSECLCDPVGSVNASCNIRNGQCNCREGVVGLRCNDCAPNHYGFSLEGCKPCECDYVGSLSLQCGPDGQCQCRENVDGRACDRCKENKHNRHAGCVNCPPCYNLVQEAVNSQRAKLNEMEKLLEDIRNTPTVISDLDFDSKLTQVQERVDQLWNDAKSTVGSDDKSFLDKINELRDKIKALDQTKITIGDSLQQCRANAAESLSNLTTTEEVVERAQEALKNAQRFLESEGNDALLRAEEKSKEYGHQNNMMSELARQARLLADHHEKQAEEIENIGNSALAQSTEAYDLAWKTISQHDNATDQSRLLQQSTQQLEDEVKTTQKKARDSLNEAKQAHENALTLFREAYSLSLPAVDLKSIKDQAIKAKSEAEKLKETLANLMKDNEQLLAESEEEAARSREILNSAVNNQQLADELLEGLDKAKASADDARNQSDNTFKRAQDIHDTLLDFNRNIEESKKKAQAAKELTPEIETLIREAGTQTYSNQLALRGAKNAASRALTDADSAKEMAEKASKDADGIRAECGETKDRAGKLRDETIDLSTKVVETSTKLSEAERKVSEDEVRVKTALEKASEAQSMAKTTYDKVQTALNTVRDIQLTLDNLANINAGKLDGLEEKIERLEQEFSNENIDDKINELRAARNRQTLWLKNYEDELTELRAEVDNIEEIRNSLPPDTKCYRKIRLEP